ncbi:unnamed protein product [Effrenium voratum]|uniref:Uncharacterized protein n=1 Tax=Effrenium voratum TaxID=2562239 RepID=A0AA36IUM1_9DINO|nr:unnamed protein product [Effrenium voratum]
MKAKKTSDSQKDDAQKEYEAGTIEEKKLILDKLQEFGVKNCSWVHSLESLTSNIKDETESLVTNFFTRQGIFEIEHIDTAGLSENDKDEILEEILSKSEKSFGHSRQVQEHSKFKQLHKYLFVYTKGKKNTEGTRTSSSMSSTAAGMKGKASQKMALDLLGRPELASSSAAEHGMSASLSEAKSESKSLQAARVRLSKLLET